MLCPANVKAQAQALGEALGWTGDNFSVPLSANGQEPATHYGLHAWAREEAVAIFTGETPADVEGAEAIRAQLIVSARDDLSAGEHFEAVLTANSLSRLDEA